MNNYILYDIILDGVVLSITTIVSILSRCVISFYTFLLLAYLNKMFNQSAENDDTEDSTGTTEMLPHGDINELDVDRMNARSCRKHVAKLLKQAMRLQLLLDSAYKDIAVLRRENDTFRLINAQANRLIADFKQQNSHVFRAATPDSSESDKNGIDSSAMATSSRIKSTGDEPSPGNKTKEGMDADVVYIKDGEDFVVGIPIFTNDLTATGAASQSMESMMPTKPAVPIVTEDIKESKTVITKPIAAEVQGLRPVTGLPGRPLTTSPSDTNIFLHMSSHSEKTQTTPSNNDEKDDSGIEVSDSSEDEEEELSSSVLSSSDEESRNQRRRSIYSSSSSEENVTDKKVGLEKYKENRTDVDDSDAHDKVKESTSLDELLKKASTDEGMITGSYAFKQFIRETAQAYPKGPVDSQTKLNVFSVWNGMARMLDKM